MFYIVSLFIFPYFISQLFILRRLGNFVIMCFYNIVSQFLFLLFHAKISSNLYNVYIYFPYGL